MNISILIVTRNRAADLVHTLDSLKGVAPVQGAACELLIVDNGSSDETPEVVRSFASPHIGVRYLLESQPGKTRALNRGLSQASGEILVSTDDDVRFPPDWLEGICEPILQGKTSVVAGGVQLAPHLIRPWMTHRHRCYLAATEWLRPEAPHGLVGANMAFSRDVLQRVPAFDTELGPGALGFGDEELFSAQLLEAGYRIYGRLELCVEHHFQACRLQRASWLSAAACRGRVNAYITYHWHHRDYRLPILRLLALTTKLKGWRMLNAGRLPEEGCSEFEIRLIYRCAELRGFLQERRRPRNYTHHGLVKHATRTVGSPAGVNSLILSKS